MIFVTEKWKRVSREIVYDGYLRVAKDHVLLPNGNTIQYDSIEQGDCACVLCVSENDNVILLRQYRYVIDDFTWEVPMGGINLGETPEEAARREMREETGILLNELTPLGVIIPSNGQSPQTMHLFFGRAKRRDAASPDESEFLEVHEITKHELQNKLDGGQITDAASLAAILLAKHKFLLRTE